MDLKLVPMYSLKSIVNTWHFIHDGLESILEHAEEDTAYERIFIEVMDGTLLLWLCFLDGRHIGFFTTRTEQNSPTTAKYFTVVHLFIKPGISPDVMIEGMGKLESIAKEKFQCKYLRFYSIRRGWERRLPDWKAGYVEYSKEI
jgi:hypothetical protein